MITLRLVADVDKARTEVTDPPIRVAPTNQPPRREPSRAANAAITFPLPAARRPQSASVPETVVQESCVRISHEWPRS